MNYAPKVTREEDRMMLPSLLSSFGLRRHCPCGVCTPVIVRSTRCRPRVEASGSRVDGLLHDDGDEAIVVIPRHTSSVAASLFVAHHPHHYHPCRPCPLLHHCCHRSPTTLVTVALSLSALFVSALIIGHALLLFITTRCCARVHRPPSTLPLLVDCCIFTPAIATAAITVSAPPPQPSTSPPQLLSSLTSSSTLPSLTLIAAATAAAAAVATMAVIAVVIAVVTDNGHPRHCRCCRRRRRRRR
jgi:hypothetical protein